MTFNSFEFLIFFGCVVFLFYIIPHVYRWAILLLASYFFYAKCNPAYGFILFLVTAVDYLLAIMMDCYEDKAARKKIFVLGIVFNLGLLFFFKYFNFFIESFSSLFGTINISIWYILLPSGISYYTFKNISYLVDVYRKEHKAEKHLGKFALYVSFFPEVLCGPIDKSKNLLPQFYQNVVWDYGRFTSGLQLMFWGYFKKLVIADRLSLAVNSVYDAPVSHSSISLLIATYFFAFQLYCDFSGYTDIAIGISKILGYDLTPNFQQPYFARSIGDFWRRWHISLSNWLRDYLFLPITYTMMDKIKSDKFFGIRVENFTYCTGILITWFLGGLWHGSRWTFVIWGLIQGLYLVVAHLSKNIRKKINRKTKWEKKIPILFCLFQIFITFHLVCFSWIFFRANSVSDAIHVVTRLFSFSTTGYSPISSILNIDTILAFISILVLLLVEIIEERQGIQDFLDKRTTWQRYLIYYIVLLYILMFGVFRNTSFIYFQF